MFKHHMMCVFASIEVGLQGCLLSFMGSHMTEESWCFVALFLPHSIVRKFDADLLYFILIFCLIL